MQLQYAYVLRQLLPLACHRPEDRADLELETGVVTNIGRNNIDILLRGNDGHKDIRIAIEMKCYRVIAASGGVRGAQNIFMRDVYEDLAVLESYMSASVASYGVALVMTDHRHFVSPNKKSGTCWAYDVSNGHTYPGGTITTPIAGKQVNITLKRSYSFDWQQYGSFWFLELEGN